MADTLGHVFTFSAVSDFLMISDQYR
jgi:hypothetical protein